MSAETFRGWLLDLYVNQQDGINLWFISETDDRRVCFTQLFPVIFYAAGDHSELRRLWKQLHGREDVTALRRIQKQDVFVADPVDVMEISMNSPAAQVKLFHQLEQEYPTLRWYNADITIQSRYIARYGAFPLALCELTANAEDKFKEFGRLTRAGI